MSDFIEYEQPICMICGQVCDNPATIVVLEDVDGEGSWAVIAVGLNEGSGLAGYFAFAHDTCLVEKGRKVGTMPGQG